MIIYHVYIIYIVFKLCILIKVALTIFFNISKICKVFNNIFKEKIKLRLLYV